MKRGFWSNESEKTESKLDGYFTLQLFRAFNNAKIHFDFPKGMSFPNNLTAETIFTGLLEKTSALRKAV